MKSFKTLIFLSIAILFSTQLKAQIDSLNISSNFIGAYKVTSFTNGEEIKGPRAISKVMNIDSKEYKYMLRSANSLLASKIIFLSGLAAGLGYAAIRISNPELSEAPFTAGIFVMSVSTGFYFISKKQARKSVAIYNESNNLQNTQSSLQFKVHPTGVGLALNF